MIIIAFIISLISFFILRNKQDDQEISFWEDLFSAVTLKVIFLNFNYTLFLESEYGVPSDWICYIHGNCKDKFG